MLLGDFASKLVSNLLPSARRDAVQTLGLDVTREANLSASSVFGTDAAKLMSGRGMTPPAAQALQRLQATALQPHALDVVLNRQFDTALASTRTFADAHALLKTMVAPVFSDTQRKEAAKVAFGTISTPGEGFALAPTLRAVFPAEQANRYVSHSSELAVGAARTPAEAREAIATFGTQAGPLPVQVVRKLDQQFPTSYPAAIWEGSGQFPNTYQQYLNLADFNGAFRTSHNMSELLEASGKGDLGLTFAGLNAGVERINTLPEAEQVMRAADKQMTRITQSNADRGMGRSAGQDDLSTVSTAKHDAFDKALALVKTPADAQALIAYCRTNGMDRYAVYSRSMDGIYGGFDNGTPAAMARVYDKLLSYADGPVAARAVAEQASKDGLADVVTAANLKARTLGGSLGT